jgi:beta-lactamase regulating signal transducer with metallopeptidase domain
MPHELFSILIAQTWQVTLLIAVVALMVRIFARDRPHLAHALWVLVLMKCIMPPLWSSPVSPFSWMRSETTPMEQRTSSSIYLTKDSPPFSNPIVVHVQTVTEDAGTRDSVAVAPDNGVNHETTATLKSYGKLNLLSDWQSLLGCIWVFGVAAGGLLSVVRFGWFIYWLKFQATESDVDLGEAVENLAKRLNLKRRTRIRVLENPIGPAVFGVIRPTVLLPTAIVRNKTAHELEPLLAHELLHIRRGDLWWAMLQTVATSLFWFHPLVWMAARMVTREAERSCDEETIACLGCRPATYARSLLEILEQKHRLRVVPALPGVRPVDITRARLERVMRLGNGLHRRTPVWIWLVMLIVGAVALPGAALVLAQETPAIVNDNTGPTSTTDSTSTEVKTSTQDVSDLLNLIRQSKTDQQSAEEILALELSAPLPHIAGSTPVDETWKEVKVSINNDRLTVVGPERFQQLIRKQVAYFREFGFDQITVETRFISVAATEFTRLGVTWSIVNSEIEALEPESSKSDPKLDDSGVARASAAENPNRKNPIRAASYVSTSATVLHALLDEQKVGSIVRKVQESPKSNILMAPRVTMFNGQQVTISDQSDHPFVVNVERLPEVVKGYATHRPVVRTVKSGIAIDMQVTKTGEVFDLDCEMEMTSIRNVASTDVQITAGEPAVTIQSPEIATVRISSANQIPVGKTLALCTTRSNSKGESEQLVVLHTFRVIPPEWAMEKAEVTQEVHPMKYPDVDVQSIEIVEPICLIRSTDDTNQSGEQISKRELVLLGVRFEIEGNVHCEVDDHQALFRGKNLTILFEDAMEVSGDQGEFKISTVPGETVSTAYRFSGNVQAKLGELVEGSADEFVLITSEDPENPISVKAQGSVKFQAKEEDSQTSHSFVADELSLGRDMKVILNGNVRYSGGDPATRLSSDHLEWDGLMEKADPLETPSADDAPQK